MSDDPKKTVSVKLSTIENLVLLGYTELKPVPATRVIHKNREFRFAYPLMVECHRENGWWYCDCKELRIYAAGSSAEIALQVFGDNFANLWDAIAQADDEKLIGDAIRMKRRMLELVEEVRVLDSEEKKLDKLKSIR